LNCLAIMHADRTGNLEFGDLEATNRKEVDLFRQSRGANFSRPRRSDRLLAGDRDAWQSSSNGQDASRDDLDQLVQRLGDYVSKITIGEVPTKKKKRIRRRQQQDESDAAQSGGSIHLGPGRWGITPGGFVSHDKAMHASGIVGPQPVDRIGKSEPGFHSGCMISVQNAKLWCDKLNTQEDDTPTNGTSHVARGEVKFERKVFAWRKPQFWLMGNIVPTHDGGALSEVLLAPSKAAQFARVQSSDGLYFAIDDVQHLWQMAFLGEAIIPDPPQIISRKVGPGRAWHMEVEEFKCERKQWISPTPPEQEEDFQATHSYAARVKKVHDDLEAFEQSLMETKAKSAYLPNHRLGWVIRGDPAGQSLSELA